ncbi:carbohydrate binding family 9 domain-containing protein [Aquimarina sp. MMG015]|uniref:DUF5916 domain-containing protein n=1 Tax=Aquimarina sp. MMG015 TaxID=2822689 RepID=UPI001B3A243D|nr:DUF5916 domain-containing protein [Aquimarina sp. MMG015]MBQ4801886.1 carbohydrate binding family 9 domain-containing protein [Aquimarina sp. MMG015]
MNRKLRPILSVLFILHTILLFGQEKKQITAHRISTSPKIDGILDDQVWLDISPSGNFNMWQPGNDGTIPESLRTEVKMAYDDKAVYFAAYLYDDQPDKILRQFSQRDNVFAQADFFNISMNTYNDGINETRFFITSAGTIGDARADQFNEDFSYNVVFDAKISFDEKGWYAEFKIPYNALRFPEIPVQDWSINFFRRLQNRNETHSWNFVDNEVGQRTQYNGLVKGVKDINPPVRLTFFPFVQGLATTSDGETETDFSAGLDVKYGLSDSFTLDATLIPDFGQAAFDEVRLNLGPFEQTFGENRQFFTEGTELFNKGRIFFSRRVGNGPTGSVSDEDLLENEIAEDAPTKVNLLNALKISGRTKGNLGIGFFNAITEKTEIRITDTITGNQRKKIVEPLANYNIFVLDQQFNNNSSISLINTNVTRNGSDFRDANVTGLVWNLANKANSYRLTGRSIVSQVNLPGDNIGGFRSELDFDRIKGKWRYGFGHDLANTTFDINDLGVNFRNNFNSFRVSTSYQIFEPTKLFNNYRINLFARHRRLYDPSVQTSNSLGVDWFFVTRERFAFGGFTIYDSDTDDYFEPRVDGRFVTFSENLGVNLWVSSDYRKKFAYDIRLFHRNWFEDDQQTYSMNLSPRYRFSDKLLVIWTTDYSVRKRNFGYIDNDDTDVFLGQRDITTVENSLSASYNFDPYKAINLRFRNFWSTADYSENIFYTLNDDGSRTQTDYDTTENDPNTNFNIWNLDLSFSWRFAPGSEATLLYRNQIFNQDELSTINYTDSLDNLFGQPIKHTLSLRVVYFLDINNLKGSFKG